MKKLNKIIISILLISILSVCLFACFDNTNNTTGSGDINSGAINSGDINSGDINSGDINSGAINSGDINSGDINSGDINSGDINSGDINSGDQTPQSTMTLVVLNGDKAKEYTVDLSKFTVTNGLLSVLDYLVSIQELTYTADGTGFLTQVNDLVQDAGKGVYLYLYTDVEADYDVSQWASTKDYNGKTLTSSGVGSKDMHIVENCTILITTIIYSY